MFVKIIIYISRISILKKNIYLKNLLKILAKLLSKLICGRYKKVSIINKFDFLIDSSFAFSNFENFHKNHNKGFEKLLEISNNTNVVFDIGAHIGLCTLPLSKVSKNVISFEASPTNLKYLNSHININKSSNVSVIPCLVGEKNTEVVDFFDAKDGSGVPSIVNIKLKRKKMSINQIKVKQLSLDSFTEENSIFPEILKIDVEGAEFNVLDGSKSLLTKYRPKIIISLHPWHLNLLGRNIQEIYNYCDEHSYQLLSCIDEHSILENELGLDEYFMKPL